MKRAYLWGMSLCRRNTGRWNTTANQIGFLQHRHPNEHVKQVNRVRFTSTESFVQRIRHTVSTTADQMSIVQRTKKHNVTIPAITAIWRQESNEAKNQTLDTQRERAQRVDLDKTAKQYMSCGEQLVRTRWSLDQTMVKRSRIYLAWPLYLLPRRQPKRA